MGGLSIYIIVTFIASLACGMVCIPLIIRFCKKKQLYDNTDTRKIHKDNIPRLGGVSFMPSMTIASVGTIFAFNITNPYDGGITISLWSAAFVVSVLAIYACGIVDDIVRLSPYTKFIVQFIASLILVMAGLYINDLHGFLGIHKIPFAIGAPLTMLAIVFIDNAFNLIDGIDGLAAGLSLIALAGFLFCFAADGLPIFCILIVGLMGVILAFMYFNLFGSVANSTKIFMGDSGSLTIGFCIGFLFVKLVMDDDFVHHLPANRLLIASSLVVIPMLDTMRVIVSRLVHRTGIFTADKNHLHHKLLRTGLNQHQALAVILAIATAFILINISLANKLTITAIAVLDIAIFAAFNIFINYKIKASGHEPFVAATH